VALARLRNRLYDRRILRTVDPPMPVVSVGNLTLGGTGKTPWVSYLLDALARPDRALGVLTRGYGESHDEAKLLAARHPGIPIEIDPDRIRGARELARRGVTLAIADDAFQHRRLGRVIDLLLIDAHRPFGNGRVLPAGTLREPIDSMKRATVIVLTRIGEATDEERALLERRVGESLPQERVFRSDLVADTWWELERSAESPAIPQPAPLAPRYVSSVGVTTNHDLGRAPAASLAPRPVSNVAGNAVILVCAIGHPASFERTLHASGLEVRHAIVRRDHHRFGARDLEEIAERAARLGARWIACTEKDLYNLPGGWRPPVPLLVPRMRVTVDREPDLLEQLEARLAT
jgi:tetraacyldisaccharide 4'-kinase